MGLTEDIQYVGDLIDRYEASAFCFDVAAEESDTAGVPPIMQVGEVDKDGWVKWRVLPSTTQEADVVALEDEFKVQLPPLFRAYLLARDHLFNQVGSLRYNQQILMSDTPSGHTLLPLCEEIIAWRPLLDAGLIPFAEWGDGWGPMCFDTTQRRPDGDCPIVWLDHEYILPLGPEASRRRELVSPHIELLYASFAEFLVDVFSPEAAPKAPP